MSNNTNTTSSAARTLCLSGRFFQKILKKNSWWKNLRSELGGSTHLGGAQGTHTEACAWWVQHKRTQQRETSYCPRSCVAIIVQSHSIFTRHVFPRSSHRRRSRTFPGPVSSVMAITCRESVCTCVCVCGCVWGPEMSDFGQDVHKNISWKYVYWVL